MLSPVTAAINKKEKEAKQFGDTYTRQVLKNYDAEALLSLSTAEYKSSFKPDEFQKTLDGNKSALGEYVSGKGRATIASSKREENQSVIRAKYENRGNFERGKAKVRIDLIYKDKKWSIEMFSIEPA